MIGVLARLLKGFVLSRFVGQKLVGGEIDQGGPDELGGAREEGKGHTGY